MRPPPPWPAPVEDGGPSDGKAGGGRRRTAPVEGGDGRQGGGQQADGSHEKGRRDYLPVLDQIVEATQGQTQARRVGGWGYRFIDKLRHYDHTRTLAQTAQCGIGQALERDYINRSRTGTVRVLPRPLSGTNYR